jgi:hypothetical protein
MDIKALRLDDNRRLTSIKFEDLSPDWLKDDVSRWVDVEAPKRDELSEFLAPLDIPQPHWRLFCFSEVI